MRVRPSRSKAREESDINSGVSVTLEEVLPSRVRFHASVNKWESDLKKKWLPTGV